MTEQAKQTIKRYDLVTNYRAGSSIEEMEPADDGEWMRYEELESALTALREERDQIKSAWDVLFQAHAKLVNKELLTRRDRQTLREGQPAASTDGGPS